MAERSMKVGVIGLGRMGSAICRRLGERGFEVVGWDRSATATRAAADKGIRTAAGARAVTAASEVVISIITEDKGSRALFTGRDGVLKEDVAGKLFIEMSTLQPMTLRDLAAATEAKGARLIDAPVLGSIPTVLEGRLFVMAGGREEDVARGRAVLDHLARRIVHLGPVGNGCAMKLSTNLCMAAYIQAVGEALSLGSKYGLAVDQVLDALGESAVATGWLKGKAAVLNGGKGDITLDIRTLRKDVMSAIATGALSGVGMPVATGALSSLSAAVAHGWGEGDIAELPRFFREFMLQSYE
jgi:3-hydroxyisobutyrate dehydrogenase-like beta-hydroxyacid dehydrogenase